MGWWYGCDTKSDSPRAKTFFHHKPKQVTDSIQPKFEAWAIVELFGHTMIAGKISEQVIAGGAFIRIDIPETEKTPAFTKLQNPSSIYGMTPVDEEYAVRMAQKLEVQPVNDYKHTQIIRDIVEKRMAQLNPAPSGADSYYGGEERPIDTGLTEDHFPDREFLGHYDNDVMTDPDFEDDFN